MCNKTYATMFKSLITAAGGVHAAALHVGSITGQTVSEGTFSKIVHGNMNVPLEWAHILEDFTGRYPFTNFRQQEVADARSHQQAGHLCAIKEASEALAAIAANEATSSLEAMAKARKEISDAVAALTNYEHQLAEAMAPQAIKAAS